MLNLKKLMTGVLFLLSLPLLFSSSVFSTYVSGVSTGPGDIASGLLPLTFSINRTKRINLLGEDEEKAHLSFWSSYGLYHTEEYRYFDDATGRPNSDWIGGESIKADYRYYFNPNASASLTLSQLLDDWTYSVSLSSRFSYPQERLDKNDPSYTGFYLSTYDENTARWKTKYSSKSDISAYPWLYGNRTNLTSYLTFSASRGIPDMKNLRSFNMSLTFEAGPKWLFNSISNDGITLSDYYRFAASASQSMLLKDEKQSTNLRWLRITLYHSNSFSYTFGKTVPQNKLGSFRLRGSLSDSFSISFAGPEIYSSENSVSFSFGYSSGFYFGGFENEQTGKIHGMAFSSTMSASFSLTLLSVLNFSYSVYYYLANGYTGTIGFRGSGEVSMSFNL